MEALPELDVVLESAAKLQQLVPDAVLVGGTAAAYYAHHRLSVDHDHVVSDLQERFELILEALEREGDWVTNRVQPGKIILGELGGIETGIRQLIRTRPLEVESVQLNTGSFLVVPTLPEILRIKAFLAVKRNQVRDYLDIAALSDRMGIQLAAEVLNNIDAYYADNDKVRGALATQVAIQLANPLPRDKKVIVQLPKYKGLKSKWSSWEQVEAVCADVAAEMVEV